MSFFAKSAPRSDTLEVLGETVTIVRKAQKNMYLSVRPDGTLRVTCPFLTDDGEIIRFVSSQADWLRKRKAAVDQRARTAGMEYKDGDVVPLWGTFYPLAVRNSRPYGASVQDGTLVLNVPAGSTREERAALVESLYRAQFKAAVPPLLRRWQPVLGVAASGVTIRAMTTRWGSCNTRTGHVTLNLRLVEKDPRCLEYVVVHELCHLRVSAHNAEFYALMDTYYPHWRRARQILNANPPRR